MINKDQYDTLKYCLDNTLKVHGIVNFNKVWYSSNDTMLTVANILDDECCFRKSSDVINFFENPHKWEGEMKELVEEYEEEQENK